jgi:hypothetical protein
MAAGWFSCSLSLQWQIFMMAGFCEVFIAWNMNWYYKKNIKVGSVTEKEGVFHYGRLSRFA